MNVLIGKIIKDLLTPLPYFDKGAGLVQTITKEDNSGSGKVKQVRFPIEVDVAEEKNAIAFVPDDSIKGMFYVEDGGSKHEGNNDWTSDITLVCWLCPKKIAGNVEAVSANAMADIMNIFKSFQNVAPVTKLKFNVVSSSIRSASIFSSYSYQETYSQYLMPPFDFFSLKIKASFRLSSSCLSPLIPADPC
ncbi:hypothetical protein SMI01S_11660 [Sphingobacterium mizutaii NBRC 14946 = DSM 11724]|uniref:Uncharacterized protein n=2 Tax=Sphingobacterium mizutaii TaxID=1010 RepID=A0AAJ5C0S7_9SPHI|nr:hypothetical protein [Sphingobacterium mizutaii]GEM67560.1 hypothetical protein SMI01S_11660 [Sphingobacterium mizutaii NBRC 14946 = DSM 11724]SDL14236.1 hypothetical protein SAMN05192578_1011500 [Sphingobacterium mizutaii]SNV52097.1 Uncharacterised protein [Sphingobacterium mizutaii]